MSYSPYLRGPERQWRTEFWTATAVRIFRGSDEVGILETNETGKGMAQRSADEIRFIIDACNEKERRDAPRDETA